MTSPMPEAVRKLVVMAEAVAEVEKVASTVGLRVQRRGYDKGRDPGHRGRHMPKRKLPWYPTTAPTAGRRMPMVIPRSTRSIFCSDPPSRERLGTTGACGCEAQLSTSRAIPPALTAWKEF